MAFRIFLHQLPPLLSITNLSHYVKEIYFFIIAAGDKFISNKEKPSERENNTIPMYVDLDLLFVRQTYHLVR